jgi:hypothetical protein
MAVPEPAAPRRESSRRYLFTPEEIEAAQAAVAEAVADHLAAGRPVFYGGSGENAGKLFMLLPDGRRFEYRRRPDGSREIIREVQE